MTGRHTHRPPGLYRAAQELSRRFKETTAILASPSVQRVRVRPAHSTKSNKRIEVKQGRAETKLKPSVQAQIMQRR